MNIFQTIGKIVVAGAMLIGGWLGYHPLGATVYTPVPRYESSLALSLTAIQTSTMSLVSGVDGNGQVLTGPMCFTVDSGYTSLVEDLCGIASGTTVTALVRGVDTSGYNASTTLSHQHRVGADVKTTDSPYLAQFYQLLNGAQGFPNPLIYASNVTNASQTANNANLVSYGLLSSVVVSGGTPATTINPGIVKIATSTDLANGNTTTTYEMVAPSELFSSSSISSKSFQVPVAVSGTIAAAFINQSGLVLTSTTLKGNTIVASNTTALLYATSTGAVTSLTVGSGLTVSAGSLSAAIFDSNNHLNITASAPTLGGGCLNTGGGSQGTIVGNDFAGSIVCTTNSANTTGTVVFHVAYSSVPTCVFASLNSTNTITSITNAGFSWTYPNQIGLKFNYVCVGNPN